MKRIRSVLGILLILLSVGGLFFWEWKGREVFLMDEVLVAGREIQRGTEVDGSMFFVKGVPKDNLLKGALRPDDRGLLEGKAASQFIAENDQIVMSYFTEPEFRLSHEESIFVIKPDWISMRSSALRRGDLVDIYGTGGLGLLGTFRIAYVKDDAEREVRDASEGEGAKPRKVSGILDRPDSTSIIDHVEIITTLQKYEFLVDCVSGGGEATPSALIIVQRGDQIDT